MQNKYKVARVLLLSLPLLRTAPGYNMLIFTCWWKHSWLDVQLWLADSLCAPRSFPGGGEQIALEASMIRVRAAYAGCSPGEVRGYQLAPVLPPQSPVAEELGWGCGDIYFSFIHPLIIHPSNSSTRFWAPGAFTFSSKEAKSLNVHFHHISMAE